MYSSPVTTRDDRVVADAVLETSRWLVEIAIRSLAVGAADVTVAQHRVLVLLDEHGPLTVNEVTGLLGVNQSNASRHCLRLEALCLVERRRAAQDARSVLVSLSPAGRRQVEAVREARRREICAVLSRMSDRDALALMTACEAYNRATVTET